MLSNWKHRLLFLRVDLVLVFLQTCYCTATIGLEINGYY